MAWWGAWQCYNGCLRHVLPFQNLQNVPRSPGLGLKSKVGTWYTEFVTTMKELGYPKLISMESFRTPNFELVAHCLQWLILRCQSFLHPSNFCGGHFVIEISIQVQQLWTRERCDRAGIDWLRWFLTDITVSSSSYHVTMIAVLNSGICILMWFTLVHFDLTLSWILLNDGADTIQL